MNKNISLVAIISNKRTKEVKYIPSNEVIVAENYTLDNLLKDVESLKEKNVKLETSFNKLVEFLKAERQEVLKNEYK